MTLGGHTEGNVKIVLEFWTQNSQYQEDKCRIRVVYSVFSTILFCFFVFIHFMFCMHTCIHYIVIVC